jgi:hypothetical protein
MNIIQYIYLKGSGRGPKEEAKKGTVKPFLSQETM